MNLLAEAVIPVLGAIEAAGIVGINTRFFAGVDQRVIQNLQSFVRPGVFPDVFVADKYVLTGARIFNPACQRRFRLSGWLGGPRCGTFFRARGQVCASSSNITRRRRLLG